MYRLLRIGHVSGWDNSPKTETRHPKAERCDGLWNDSDLVGVIAVSLIASSFAPTRMSLVKDYIKHEWKKQERQGPRGKRHHRPAQSAGFTEPNQLTLVAEIVSLNPPAAGGDCVRGGKPGLAELNRATRKAVYQSCRSKNFWARAN